MMCFLEIHSTHFYILDEECIEIDRNIRNPHEMKLFKFE